MINWQSVIFNSFWVLGLSVLLAAISYHAWYASESGTRLRAQLASSSFLRFFWIAVLLVCIGLAGTSRYIWETIIWAGMAVLALFFTVRMFANK